jgi:S1-C subfamily serine protease
MHLPGSTVRIETARTPDGPRRTHTVRLAKFYVPGPVLASQRPPARSGLRVDYTSILIQRLPLNPWGRGPPPGVLIREVVPNSPADRAQLQVDKIITKVNKTPVTTPAEFYRERREAGGSVELSVLNADGREERISLDLN